MSQILLSRINTFQFYRVFGDAEIFDVVFFFFLRKDYINSQWYIKIPSFHQKGKIYAFTAIRESIFANFCVSFNTQFLTITQLSFLFTYGQLHFESIERTSIIEWAKWRRSRIKTLYQNLAIWTGNGGDKWSALFTRT